MCIKIDKEVWKNSLYSFFGGIFAGIVVAFSLGQTPPKGTLGYYFVSLLFFLFLFFVLLLIMGFLNYIIDWSEEKASKKRRKAK